MLTPKFTVGDLVAGESGNEYLVEEPVGFHAAERRRKEEELGQVWLRDLARNVCDWYDVSLFRLIKAAPTSQEKAEERRRDFEKHLKRMVDDLTGVFRKYEDELSPGRNPRRVLLDVAAIAAVSVICDSRVEAVQAAGRITDDEVDEATGIGSIYGQKLVANRREERRRKRERDEALATTVEGDGPWVLTTVLRASGRRLFLERWADVDVGLELEWGRHPSTAWHFVDSATLREALTKAPGATVLTVAQAEALVAGGDL